MCFMIFIDFVIKLVTVPQLSPVILIILIFLMTVNDSSFIKEKIKFDKKRVRLPTLTEVGRGDETPWQL